MKGYYLFVDDVDKGIKVCCEFCDTDFIIESNPNKLDEICPNEECKAELIYPLFAEW